MAKSKRQLTWPAGILSRVSREAFDEVTRLPGFADFTPETRELAARRYDAQRRQVRCLGCDRLHFEGTGYCDICYEVFSRVREMPAAVLKRILYLAKVRLP